MKRVWFGGSHGFTLPELIVAFFAVSIVGAIAAALLHQNPQTITRNNAERRTSEAAIMLGVSRHHQKTGAFPAGITTEYKGIGSENGELDLCKDLVPTYMDDLTYDPVSGMVTQDGSCNAKGQKYHTGYNIKKSSDDASITIAATSSEGGKVIVLTKRFK